MSTITQTTETRGEGPGKRPLGNLQARIDEGLLDRADLLATRRSIQERRKIHRRDIVEEALASYLPEAERKVEELATAEPQRG